MKMAETIIRRKKTVVVIWAIAFLALTPLILNYSHFINYSISSNSLSNTESGRAQSILSTLSRQNSSLIVVLQPTSGESIAQLANQSLTFQNSLDSKILPYYANSTSAFSSYASFLDSVLSPSTITTIRTFYGNFSSLSTQIYTFPSAFLGNWSASGYTQNSIAQAASRSGYNYSNNYESAFISALNKTFSSQSSMSGSARIQNATQTAALATFGKTNPVVSQVVGTNGYNVTNYDSSLMLTAGKLLTDSIGHPVTVQVLQSVLGEPQNPGEYYVSTFGLLSAPSFVTQGTVSSDNSTYLIIVNLNVTENYRGPNNFYPAQNATAELRTLAQQYFGREAEITGQGAIAYDTQKLSASSGFVFAFTFVFLAIAVAIVLASYLTPILALIFVSLATGLGYVSIYITGVVVGKVDYTVTYTLTAVILGVATDYFVFILSRYREELRGGKTNQEALHEATDKAGFAVLVSGITVAGSLGALSFVADLRTWGPVLLISILLTVALMTTLLPAVVNLIGPRLFLKRTLVRKTQPSANASQFFGKNSMFYRATKFSERHKFLVIGVILLLAVPAIYFWFNVPTTYDFNEGLPSSLPSVQALNTVNTKFGSDLIYPNYVIVNFTQSALNNNGTLTASAQTTLSKDASYLLSEEGVKTVVGPMINGNKVGVSLQSTQFIFNHGMNAYFLVFTNYDPYSKGAISLVKDLRTNSTFLVGGLTSSVIDLQSYYSTAYTQVEILILVVIALVLGLSFRSIKYPIISLSGVFISITWTTGLLYEISKYILKEDLVFLIPIILFVILMSLGNDFTVFIISRVREEQQKFGFEEGLARAMVGSGSVVTALGLILAASLGSLALVPFGFLEQLGIAFVISLVLDTFIIRTLYFPAMILALKGKNHHSVQSAGLQLE
jgi:RND superfamily putative drug exporter